MQALALLSTKLLVPLKLDCGAVVKAATAVEGREQHQGLQTNWRKQNRKTVVVGPADRYAVLRRVQATGKRPNVFDEAASIGTVSTVLDVDRLQELANLARPRSCRLGLVVSRHATPAVTAQRSASPARGRGRSTR